jgi:hypothetical protein
MSGDDFDKMVRNAVPAVAITDQRIERLITATLRAAAQPEPRRFGWRLPSWMRLTPVMQYALPVFVALILGFSVGGDYADDWPLAQFNALMLSTPLYVTGS